MGVLRQPTVPITTLCRPYLESEKNPFFLFSLKTQIFSEKYLHFLISHDQASIRYGQHSVEITEFVFHSDFT